MPRHADQMKRWESIRYIADALRAYVDRKPLRVETEPDWPLVVKLASEQLVSPMIGLVLTRQPEVADDVKEYFAAVIALNRERNAILENAIRDIIGALNRAGMTPLLMKGVATCSMDFIVIRQHESLVTSTCSFRLTRCSWRRRSSPGSAIGQSNLPLPLINAGL
jgi:Uncharacterised nucleotidyltransferase